MKGLIAEAVLYVPDWPHLYVVMTASDVNDANESAASATADIEMSL